jgi:predicted esterase
MMMWQPLTPIALILALTTQVCAQNRQHDLESRDAQKCHSQENRVHVAHPQGRECVAYRFFEQSWRPADPVVVFLHGDPAPDEIANEKTRATLLANLHQAAKQDVLTHSVKILVIERPGTFGSSGDHYDIRRTRLEVALVSGAIDLLKEKFNIATFSIAGQSGGASVAAGIMTLGRTDISCAVLASGRYELVVPVSKGGADSGALKQKQHWLHRYDIADDIDGIAKSEKRRILVVADPNDRVVPFAGQRRFADALSRKGHPTQFQPLRAQDDNRHVLVNEALRLAARCANQLPADMWFSGMSMIEQKRR